VYPKLKFLKSEKGDLMKKTTNKLSTSSKMLKHDYLIFAEELHDVIDWVVNGEGVGCKEIILKMESLLKEKFESKKYFVKKTKSKIKNNCFNKETLTRYLYTLLLSSSGLKVK